MDHRVDGQLDKRWIDERRVNRQTRGEMDGPTDYNTVTVPVGGVTV
jgi:hypothetical protein